jgi:hypothetical protein
MTSKRKIIGATIGGVIALVGTYYFIQCAQKKNGMRKVRFVKNLLASLNDDQASPFPKDKVFIRGTASAGGLLGSATFICIFF